jgi:hypothetical protein
MVIPYLPEAGDIVMMDFDPQVGHEQAMLWTIQEKEKETRS